MADRDEPQSLGDAEPEALIRLECHPDLRRGPAEADPLEAMEDAWAMANAREATREEPW